MEEKALRYDQGKPDWTLLDFPSIESAVRVMEYGATKYARENWKNTCDDPRQHIRCAFRHLIALASGEEIDKESNERHAGHVICNMMMYMFHVKDDRKINYRKSICQDDCVGTKLDYTSLKPKSHV